MIYKVCKMNFFATKSTFKSLIIFMFKILKWFFCDVIFGEYHPPFVSIEAQKSLDDPETRDMFIEFGYNNDKVHKNKYGTFNKK